MSEAPPTHPGKDTIFGNQDVDTTVMEEEVASKASGERRFRLSFPQKLMAVVAGFAAIAVVIWVIRDDVEIPESDLSRAPSLPDTPGGKIQAESEEFQDAVRKENQTRLSIADETGQSAIATSETTFTSEQTDTERTDAFDLTEEDPVPTVEETQVSLRDEPQTTSQSNPTRERSFTSRTREPQTETRQQNTSTAQQAEPPENPFAAGILDQMAFVSSKQVPRPMYSETLAAPQSMIDAEQSAEAGDPSMEGQVEEDVGMPLPEVETLAAPGDIFYGEVLIGVSSDLPSPVIVKVTAGEFKDARMVGSFQLDMASNKFVVQFNQITLPSGETLPFNGLAVDGKSAEVAVRSDIERRYVQRYGPMLAVGFVGGLARAAASTASAVTISDGVTEVTQAEATRDQAIASGVSAAIDAISTDVLASVPRGPKVSIRAGYPIAIIAVSPVVKTQ